ncbi:MAG: chemotaxis protein CheD [Halopseudomonas sp.]
MVLNPGDWFFGHQHEQVKTLLGSCVAITLWHPRLAVGGMCHFLLPSSGKPVGETLDGRYADQSMALFMEAIHKHASKPEEYRVKMFGGGNMFPDTTSSSDVGDRNVLAAKTLLREHGFRKPEAHVGQQGHRTIILDLATGETWLRWQHGKVVM